MTDRSKFEQMLEHLINEDQDKATELFHQLVVEKSRQIYKDILAESFEDEMGSEDEGDAFGGEDNDIGGDATDDFIDDIESDDSESESEYGADEDGELEDRVIDLEDALDDLRAEFEELMAQENGEEGEDFGGEDNLSDFDDSMGSEGEEDSSEFDHESSDFEDDDFKESFFREYVEKVSVPKGGDNGGNTKSVVAKPNRMGGSSANIARGGEEKTGGTKGGLLKPSAQEQDFGNINKPGGNAGKTAFKKREPGHGPEKKGSANPAPNTKSVLGGKR